MNPLLIPAGWATPLERYTAWLVAAARPQSTIYLRVYHLRRFARQSGAQPFAVTLGTLVDHMAANPGWAPATRRSVRSSLRGFYTWALLTERMATNPALQLPRVPLTAGRPHPAHDVAVQSGLHAGDERVRLMVKLGAYAGLRCCEIARVHTTDVYEDLVGWSLRVVGKGRKERTIPLSDTLALEMRQHPAGWLFPGQIDGHLSAAYVSKIISRAMPAGTTAHGLRHRFASRAFKGSGYNLRAVQELLGHASVATTQIYTAVDDDELRRAALSAAA